MKNRNLKLLFLLFVFFTEYIVAQDSLSYEKYIGLVKAFHPIAKKSNLEIEISKNKIKSAKGQFDPVIGAKIGKKTLNGTNYYNDKSLELYIPTWYGMNVIGKANNVAGNRLDNSTTTGQYQTLGVELPLAKGLFFYERRATLKQAQKYLTMTENEQNIVMNDLILNASEAYIEWLQHYKTVKIIREGLKNAQELQNMVRKAYEFGERPAIDTVEVRSQLQHFQIKLHDAETHFQNAKIKMAQFLWNSNQQQILVPEQVSPQELGFRDAHLSDSIFDETTHNVLAYYKNKGEFLDIEKRLKFQSLLPKIDFVYNFIYRNNNPALLFQDNFQYGIKAEIPIFQRTARADYINTKIKIQQNILDFQQKKQEISVKYQEYKNDLENYILQSKLAEENVKLAEQLLRGEHIRFKNGESSVFLLNSRQVKLLESREKQAEIHAKGQKSLFKIRWIQNMLYP